MSVAKTKSPPKKDATVSVVMDASAFTAYGNLPSGATVELPKEIADEWIAAGIAKEQQCM